MAGTTPQSTIDETDKQKHEDEWLKRGFHTEFLSYSRALLSLCGHLPLFSHRLLLLSGWLRPVLP